ncbi:hypothetical protein [Bartonella sp. MR30HLJHH]|uniref:hypothetical protein n=1 Tax=Bartonella sp. MR30HLJHH TaxID=3243557 RepID=UPI0035CF614A
MWDEKDLPNLKIAETITEKGKRVLFFILSFLIPRTIREWTADTEPPLHSFSVYSDTQVSNRRKNQDDAAMDTYVLYPTGYENKNSV